MGDLYQGLLFGVRWFLFGAQGGKIQFGRSMPRGGISSFFWFLWGPKLLLFDVDVDMYLLPETPFAEGTVMGRLVE